METLRGSSGYGLREFLTRRLSTHSISRVAGLIESEIQAWIDRESIETLTKALKEWIFSSEEELIQHLSQLENRVSQGFNRELQSLVLKSKLFLSLQSVLCDHNSRNKVREHAARCIAALIRFNKDVFVGQVLMGATIHALLKIGTTHSMKVLCALIKLIKSPFVDEMVSHGEIPKIISLLDSKDMEMRVLAMDCILEIGYFGRREAVEAMLKEGLIKKLVELQRSELGGDLIGEYENRGLINGNDKKRREVGGSSKLLESYPLASCVARFAVQLEVGEGLRQREKREFKQEILVRVREACFSDAEAATILAEVLWGSSP